MRRLDVAIDVHRERGLVGGEPGAERGPSTRRASECRVEPVPAFVGRPAVDEIAGVPVRLAEEDLALEELLRRPSTIGFEELDRPTRATATRRRPGPAPPRSGAGPRSGPSLIRATSSSRAARSPRVDDRPRRPGPPRTASCRRPAAARWCARSPWSVRSSAKRRGSGGAPPGQRAEHRLGQEGMTRHERVAVGDRHAGREELAPIPARASRPGSP